MPGSPPHIDVSDLTVGQKNTDNAAISGWVEKSAGLYKPDQIFWCSGSEAEKKPCNGAMQDRLADGP
jgi:GTP-dependent phosphoenolpyruvate carboxykinase